MRKLKLRSQVTCSWPHSWNEEPGIQPNSPIPYFTPASCHSLWEGWSGRRKAVLRSRAHLSREHFTSLWHSPINAANHHHPLNFSEYLPVNRRNKPPLDMVWRVLMPESDKRHLKKVSRTSPSHSNTLVLEPLLCTPNFLCKDVLSPFCQMIFFSVKTFVSFYPILHEAKHFHWVFYFKMLLQVKGGNCTLKNKLSGIGLKW